MWGPDGYQIITPNVEPTLGIKTVNITSAVYKLFSLKPEEILVRERLEYYYSIKELLTEIKTEEKTLEIPLNDLGIGKVFLDLKPYLRGENYGVIAYSFRSPIVQCYQHPIKFHGLILRTNIGIFSQFHPTTAIIRARINAMKNGVKNVMRRVLGRKIHPLEYAYWFSSYYREISSFFNCLNNNETPPITVHDGLRAIKTIEEIKTMAKKEY